MTDEIGSALCRCANDRKAVAAVQDDIRSRVAEQFGSVGRDDEPQEWGVYEKLYADEGVPPAEFAEALARMPDAMMAAVNDWLSGKDGSLCAFHPDLCDVDTFPDFASGKILIRARVKIRIISPADCERVS